MDPECWSFNFDFLFCASFAGYTKILEKKKSTGINRIKGEKKYLSTLDELIWFDFSAVWKRWNGDSLYKTLRAQKA